MLQEFTIHDAIRRGDATRVEALIHDNLSVVDSIDSDGATPLHVAAHEEDRDGVETLLANDADVDAVDCEGWTPLHVAAQTNASTDVIEMLLNYGADVNARDYQARTPLYYARDAGYPEVMQLLREHGAIF